MNTVCERRKVANKNIEIENLILNEGVNYSMRWLQKYFFCPIIFGLHFFTLIV